MSYYQKKIDFNLQQIGNEPTAITLLTQENGCSNGCCAGKSCYPNTEYAPAGVHEDQEGFLVLSGKGWVKVGEEEFLVEKEDTFIAPKGVAHQMKSSNEKEPLIVFWFHAQA